MRKVFFQLFWGAVAVIGAVAVVVWVRQGVSDQELLANVAKAEDFWRGIVTGGGWPWWSPHFLQGTSLAFAWGTVATSAVALIFSSAFGVLIGSKAAVAVVVIAGGGGMFCFLRRWAGSERAAVIGAAVYLVFPSVLTRAVDAEHFVVVVSMAVLPWVFWALTGFLRRGTGYSALVAGAWTALLLLAYGKTAVMALPVLLVFGCVEYFQQPRGGRPEWWGLGIFAAVAGLLGVVPNLPALREVGFVAMFEFGPFEGWQSAFSTKSALSWFDRSGVLGAGMDAGFAPSTLNGGTYLGLVGAPVLVAAVLRGLLHSCETGRRARLMLVFALGMFWLSFGPRSVFGGHFEFLGLSRGAADFTPAIAWFLLGAQVWIVFQLVPPGWPFSRWVAGLAALGYLFVPGFRLIEWMPLYGNIRAPFDFYQVTGAVCVVAAVALAAACLLDGIRTAWARRVAAVVLVVLMVLDQGVYAVPMAEERLPREVWEDFNAAQEFLKSAPVAGRVYPFSGRYFYLMTPWISGRPLSSEAFNNYLQQRGVAVLQGTAFLDDTHLEACLRISGVAYLLVDKSDPDTAQALQKRLRSLFPVAFENGHFVVLEVKETLGSGFLARDIVQASDNSPVNALAALGGATHNLAMLEMPGAPAGLAGLQGRVEEGRIIAVEGRVMDEGRPFLPLKGGMERYQTAQFEAPGEAGWLVFNEAWHPDWKAYVDGKSVPVKRAMLAFSAVETDGSSPVFFRFEQPWWYDWCAWGAVAGWVGVLAAGVAGVWRKRS